MPRTCGICRDLQLRDLIDSSLLLGTSTLADLSRRTGHSEDSLGRHRKHLPKAPTDTSNMQTQLDTWLARVNQLFVAANANGDLRVAVESARSALALLAERQKLAERKGANFGELSTDEKIDNLLQNGIPYGLIDRLMAMIESGQHSTSNPLQ